MPEQQKRIPSRRERRAQLKANGVLKALSKLPYGHPLKKQVCEANQETGKKIHQAHVDKIDAANATFLENKLNAMKATWATQDYTEEELKMLEEAWVLSNVVNKETYREDRKEAKVLQNKIKASKAARNS